MGNDAPKRMDTPNSISRAEVRHHEPRGLRLRRLSPRLLREKREAAGLGVAELAAKAKVAPSTVRRLESRRVNATLWTVSSIAEVLGCPMDELSEPVDVERRTHSFPTFDGAAVSRARLARGLSEQDLAATMAERLGEPFRPQIVADLERGVPLLTAAHRRALAEVLGIDDAALLPPRPHVTRSELTGHRECLGISVDEVARLSGLTTRQVRALEADPLDVPLRDLVAWAPPCGYSAESVLVDVLPNLVHVEAVVPSA